MKRKQIGYLIIALAIISIGYFLYYATNIYPNTLQTQYVLAKDYPIKILASSGIFNPYIVQITFYGLNQSNGTACIINATIQRYSFNFTSQKYYLSNTTIITNRNALIALVGIHTVQLNKFPDPAGIIVNQTETLVCPQGDFAK